MDTPAVEKTTARAADSIDKTLSCVFILFPFFRPALTLAKQEAEKYIRFIRIVQISKSSKQMKSEANPQKKEALFSASAKMRFFLITDP
jgi:hypothetical protein